MSSNFKHIHQLCKILTVDHCKIAMIHSMDFKDIESYEFIVAANNYAKEQGISHWLINSTLDVYEYLDSVERVDGDLQYVNSDFFAVCASRFGNLNKPYHIVSGDYDIIKKYSSWQNTSPNHRAAASVHYAPAFFNIYHNIVSNSSLTENDLNLTQKNYSVFVNRPKHCREQLLKELQSQQMFHSVYGSWNGKWPLWRELKIPKHYKRCLPADWSDPGIESTQPGTGTIWVHGSADDRVITKTYTAVQADVVAETLTHLRFITEKTVRPLLWGMPFLTLAGQGQLQMLREMGFETFPELWDESYDQHRDLNSRAAAIVSQMQDLNKNTVKEKLKHNRNLALKFSETDPIENILKKSILCGSAR